MRLSDHYFKRKRLIIFFLASFILMLIVGAGLNQPLFADSHSEVCKGISELSSGVTCSSVTTKNSVSKVVTSIISFLSYLLGVLSIIMIIIGGLRFILSAGESNKVSQAKKTIIYAVLGLVIAALTQFILHILINTSASLK